MQAINEGVYDWNIEANTIFYSDGVRAALGLEPDMLRTPRDWLNRIHGEDKANYNAALVAHFRGDTPRFEHEFRYQGSGGEWRWARQHGIARVNENGRAQIYAGAARHRQMEPMALRATAPRTGYEASPRGSTTERVVAIAGGPELPLIRKRGPVPELRRMEERIIPPRANKAAMRATLSGHGTVKEYRAHGRGWRICMARR
jgi:PAS domain-containing protein